MLSLCSREMKTSPSRQMKEDLEAARAARLGPRAARLMRFNDWFFEHYLIGMLIGVPLGLVVIVPIMMGFFAAWDALPIDPVFRSKAATDLALMASIVVGGTLLNVEVRRRMARGIRQRTGVPVAWWRIPRDRFGVWQWQSDPRVFDAWLEEQRAQPASTGSRWHDGLPSMWLLVGVAAFAALLFWHWQIGLLAGALALLLFARPRNR